MIDDSIPQEHSTFSLEMSTNKNNYSKLSNTEEEINLPNKIITNKKNNINTLFSYSNISNFTINFKKLIIRSKLGNTYSFCNDNYGNPFIIIGPQWYFYPLILIFFSLILYSYKIFFENFLTNLTYFLGYLFYFLWIISYTISFFSNPGYPKIEKNSVQGNNNMIYCEICEIWSNKKDFVHHCEKCDICVEQWEHHSRLIGGCVGKGNKNSFLLCLIMIFIILLYMIIGIGMNLKNFI